MLKLNAIIPTTFSKLFIRVSAKQFYCKSVEDWDDPLKQNLSSSWDFNWDKRADAWKSSGDCAVRVNKVLLVRNAQTKPGKSDEKGGVLSTIGKSQAKQTGERLRQSNMKFTKFVYADRRETRDTARHILPYIMFDGDNVNFQSCGLLQDCKAVNPTPSFSPSTARHYFEKAPLAEAAFRTYFYRPFPNAESSEENVLIVCHGDLISYFILRYLDQCLLLLAPNFIYDSFQEVVHPFDESYSQHSIYDNCKIFL